MLKIEIMQRVCGECEDFDKNYDEVTQTYPLATEVITFWNYAPNKYVCSDCYEQLMDTAVTN